MTYLMPDKVRTEKIGNATITIKEKVIPGSAKANKDVAGHVKKGQPMKPSKQLDKGKGKPTAITVHNTGDIKTPSATNPAEQYTRATWPNCNMGGVVVHFYVYKNEIWQNLLESERGWHAADGSSRRTDHRGKQTGGNLDTIAIECIGPEAQTEDTTAKLTAYLCKKYNLEPSRDVYTHNFWMYGKDELIQGARKNCPIYILPHWPTFLSRVSGYLEAPAPTPPPTSDPSPSPSPSPVQPGTLYRVQTGAFANKANATDFANKIKAKGFATYMIKVGLLYKVQVGAFGVKANATDTVAKLKAAGIYAFITTESGTAIPIADAASKAEIKVGSKVKVKAGAKTYTNGKLLSFVYRMVFNVIQVTGDRVVVGIGKTVTAAVNEKDIVLL